VFALAFFVLIDKSMYHFAFYPRSAAAAGFGSSVVACNSCRFFVFLFSPENRAG
jgi:hypothetical protein